jgi:AcrR family transcriptional regulator
VTDAIDRPAESTRLQILLAASHQFAHRSYSLVSLDDILADAEVTKGAMYFHFRSKHALALAIIDYQASRTLAAVNDLRERKLSGLETLIDLSFLIAVRDIGDDVARAGLHLLESIGRTDGVQAKVLGEWVNAFAAMVEQAIEEGDIVEQRNPQDVSRLLVSMYLGMRQTSSPDDPEQFLGHLEKLWAMALPGFANPGRVAYLTQFIRRRTALAIDTTTAALPNAL